MNFKKIICAILCAVLLVCSSAAFAEDEHVARIAELEAELAETKAQLEEALATIDAYYIKTLVARFDGGEVLLADAQAEYAYWESMYQTYGISLAESGYEEMFKQDVITGLVSEAVVAHMAHELGLDVLDEAQHEEMHNQAHAAYDTYLQTYYEYYFAPNFENEEEGKSATAEYLNQNGYSLEEIEKDMTESYVREAVYNFITKDVALTEDDIVAAYEAMIASNKSEFEGSTSAYETARSSNSVIAWHPEGYRMVKHVLLAFNDEQTQKYSELIGIIEACEAELAAEPDAETEPRAEADIQADIDAAKAELEALYAEIMPQAQTVVERFNAGEEFDALMAELGADPGMKQEPGISEGYAVSAASTRWDPAFTEGAMSINAIGEISEPVKGMNGVHVIYYASDVTPGEIALEDIRDYVEQDALDSLMSDTYNNKVEEWVKAANVEYFMENFIN